LTHIGSIDYLSPFIIFYTFNSSFKTSSSSKLCRFTFFFAYIYKYDNILSQNRLGNDSIIRKITVQIKAKSISAWILPPILSGSNESYGYIYLGKYYEYYS
jgi:hypothetical protein